MKILLVGEYSRLHNSLKEGLECLGHTAVIVASGDNFKNYTVDYSIRARLTSSVPVFKLVRKGILKLTGFDIEKTERGLRFYFLLPKLKDFDHVQLINSDALETHPAFARWLYKKLLKQNNKMSLLVCGDEPPIIDHNLSGTMAYSIMSPYIKDKTLKAYYSFALKYTTNSYRGLFDWVKNHSTVLIASDLDYKFSMEAMGYDVIHVPNPVNIDKITYNPLRLKSKIIIFMGINRLSAIKKGIPHFEEALEIIKTKYKDRIEIVIAESLPYDQYIKHYCEAHILLDYTYGLDQGYNALEAMAAGKVVFTGASPELMQYYRLTEPIAIHTAPHPLAIAGNLAHLIENPEEIAEISLRARAFIEKEHNYIDIAKKYIEVWC